MADEHRIMGTVIASHLVESSVDKYGGSYGLLRGDDGKVYVWSERNVFRNMSHMEIGARARFTVVAYSYATDITTKFSK